MKFKSLYVGQVSATFEIDNSTIYYAEEPYDVYVSGALVIEGERRNVFTIFNLKPGTDYTIRIGNDAMMIKTEPSTFEINIKDFLSPFSENDDTLGFQAAIMVLPKGGRIVVPSGDYHISSLFLKSHMTLVLEKGATIHGTHDKSRYAYMPGELPFPNGQMQQITSWEGNPFHGMSSIVCGYNLENVAIVGEGIIDGEAQNSDFWVDVKNKPFARPRLLFFNNCERVVLQGITVQNSPSWTIHPFFCKDVQIFDLKIRNPKDSPNTDGIDPECCDGVKIIGVHFSVGDDCIALKSGKIYVGSTYKKPTRHVEIRNCLMHEGHGAVVLGSEVGAGIKDIAVERCIFDHTDRGLRIKTRRGRGKDSVIDGIVFRNIRMDGVLTPLVMNMFYFCDPDGHSEVVRTKEKLPVDASTPLLGKFRFENIIATDAQYAIGWFYGLPEQPIGEVVIKDSSFTVKDDSGCGFPAMMDDIEKQSKRGFVCYSVSKIILDNVKVTGFEGEMMDTTEVGSVKIT